VSTYCPQIFSQFVEALNTKKNKAFRAELWEYAFKYIYHFNSCRKVSELDLTTTTIKYDVYQKNLVKLEQKIKEVLKDKEDDLKLTILDRIRDLSLESSEFLMKNVLTDIANLLWKEKE
jgi:hypothetical protein